MELWEVKREFLALLARDLGLVLGYVTAAYILSIYLDLFRFI
jgi:hypothetical protein